MFRENFVMSVKVNNKVLREEGLVCYVPFGSEYTLLLKNLESRKAKVKVWVDGEDTLDGHSILLNPNETVELEGFIDGMSAKNAFKFIEKIKEISEFRGDKVDDGLIRVEVTYEMKKPQSITTFAPSWSYKDYNDTPNYDIYRTYSTSHSNGTVKGMASNTQLDSINCNSNVLRDTLDSSLSCSSANLETRAFNMASFNKDGITVKGQEINQQFKYGTIGELETTSTVLVLQLKGEIAQTPIKVPITVETKLQCTTCGKVSRSDAKFCDRCGAYLSRINKKV